jgi:hypothetical protein
MTQMALIAPARVHSLDDISCISKNSGPINEKE